MAKVLECKNLNKKIGKKDILKNVSLEVQEGDILGFIGPNGAGKTTTIKLILGLQKITSGEVKINGYDIKKDFEKAIERVSVSLSLAFRSSSWVCRSFRRQPPP